MAEKLAIYKCNVCGNMVEAVNQSAGAMTCCGQAMIKMNENSTDAAVEKHVPVLTRKDGGWLVNVGAVDHPMLAEHLIEWIELLTPTSVYRAYLKPGDKPCAFFTVADDKVSAREYCNL
ncbi:MAG: desulfoferrodoxin, partial [Bacteroidales bacterium]|nr:desulfoferrodoxin [Bacteroidales bacterium]